MISDIKLVTVKLIHTVIWIFFNVVIFYLAYAVIINKIDIFVWIGVGIIIAEGGLLMLFGNKCPLTVIARNYSDSDRHNFDIYLPEWLAKYNKLIYTTAFIIILGGIVFRLFNN